MARKSNNPKPKKAPFKVGEVVETDFHFPKNAWAKHRVVAIHESDNYGSGYGVALDPEQKACPCCNRPFERIGGIIDSDWCRKVAE